MSTGVPVLIVQTGIANTASIIAGLERIGANPRLTSDPEEVNSAERVVLPGVGAFAAGMQRLREENLAEVLRERVLELRPTLAVCLGLQLLFATSEESPGVEGLAVFQQEIRRFPDTVRVPQLGWNRVEPNEQCQFLEAGFAYFANSYRATNAPENWGAAYAEHGERFVAALERGPVLCCQFHPELSSAWGLALLDRWVNSST